MKVDESIVRWNWNGDKLEDFGGMRKGDEQVCCLKCVNGKPGFYGVRCSYFQMSMFEKDLYCDLFLKRRTNE